jgi:hypothetical protein
VDAGEPVGGAVERVFLVGDLVGDGVAGVLAGVGGRGVDLGQRVIDLGRALGVVEVRDRLAELLAVGAGLVGLGRGPDGDREGGEQRREQRAAGKPAQQRPAAARPGRLRGRGGGWCEQRTS